MTSRVPLHLLFWAALALAPAARAQTPPPQCLDGQVVEATGHCCWPGQTFGEESGLCRGRPSCPPGLAAEGESCVVGSCPSGQLRTPDQLHCCWPGQEWSHATSACIGVASCPAGFGPDASGNGCVPLPPPPPTPPLHCEPPLLLEEGRCLSPAEQAQRAAEQKWGSSALVFGLGYGFLGAPLGKVYGHSFEGTFGYHPAGIPLLASVGGSIGGFLQPGAPCASSASCIGPSEQTGTLYSWRVGAAFAPFGQVRSAPWSISPMNPFIGVDAMGVHYSPTQPGRASPRNALVPALDFGNAFFIEEQSFVVHVTASANGDGMLLGLNVELPGLVVLLCAGAH